MLNVFIVRDRDLQLRIFLHNMHYFLAKQQLEYGIFIIEQVHNQTFNRGRSFPNYSPPFNNELRCFYSNFYSLRKTSECWFCGGI